MQNKEHAKIKWFIVVCIKHSSAENGGTPDLTNISPIYEPWHDKTNKMSVRPVKTQISLGICINFVGFVMSQLIWAQGLKTMYTKFERSVSYVYEDWTQMSGLVLGWTLGRTLTNGWMDRKLDTYILPC